MPAVDVIPQDPRQVAYADQDYDPCGNCGSAEGGTTAASAVADDLRKSCGSAESPLDTTPLPLAGRIERPTFPVAALGETLGSAAERLAYYVQVPLGMAAQSVLATAALCCQHLIDVERGPHGKGPVSLFCITIAGSGDRKSTADNLAMKPVRDFERARAEQAAYLLAEYKAEHTAWKLRKDSIEKAGAKAASKGMTREEQCQLRDKLLELEATRPKAPERSNIVVSEPTSEGLYRHFLEGLPTAGIFNDDAIGFFGGHGMSDENRGRMIAMQSHLWDGKPLTRTRAADGESSVLIDRRLSAHLMMQPIVSMKILSDPLLMGQGFLPRFLICHEDSLAGTRFLSGRDPQESAQNDPAIGSYWQRLRELLEIKPDIEPATGGLQLKTMKIEGEAYKLWTVLFDGIEKESGPDRLYHDIRAFASKAGENAARIAATLATVEGSSEIKPGHIRQAGELISYYLESMRINTQEAQIDQEMVEAQELLEWLRAHGGTLSAHDFNRLPNRYRGAKKARAVLKMLTEYGHIIVTKHSTHNGKASAWRLNNA